MRTRNVINVAGFCGPAITIPAGTPVFPATNQPGEKFWVETFDGLTEDQRQFMEVVGVLVYPNEVEED